MRESRRRLLTFAVVVIGCLVTGSLYVTWAVARASGPEAEKGTTARLDTGSVVFRSLDGKKGRRGRIAVVRNLASGKRAVTGVRCDRVYAKAEVAVCLSRVKAFGIAYDAIVYEADLRRRLAVRFAGIPSRVRISPDGRHGAVTSFVTGHSYAAPGQFSTQTRIFDLESGRILLDLEQLTVALDGGSIDGMDRNYWGVTFAANGRFYATVASEGETFLIQGIVGSKRARALIHNAECPSLSPDETRVAYKKRVGGPTTWRLYVLDLNTGRETRLSETKTVDDQVEWLDDTHILYGRDKEIWKVRADGTGSPRLVVRRSDSPAVIRG